MDITLRDYAAPPTLAKFLASDAFVRLVLGPVGSGKSSACCLETLRRACEAPVCLDGVRHSRGLIVRNTYPELRDTTMKTYKQWVPSELGAWHVSDKTFTMSFTPEDNIPVECEVLFRSLDTVDDVKKLLSMELTWAYINEVREVPKAAFKLILTRLRRYPAVNMLVPGDRAWSGLWADSNPPDDDHWLYKRIEEEIFPEGVQECFKQPSGVGINAENLENLDSRYYQDIIDANRDDPEHVKVYVHGEYGCPRTGKPVIPEYHEDRHCDASLVRLPNATELLLGMDFGLTPAVVIGQRDPRDGQLQIIDEVVSEELGARSFADVVVKHLNQKYPGLPVRGYGDPAGDERSQADEKVTPFSIVRAAGLPLTPAPTNDPVIRRDAVGLALSTLTITGRPSLVIHPRCRTLRKGLNGRYCYRRIQVSLDKFADKPDKNKYSHVCDALQYLCVGDGEGRRPVEKGAGRPQGSRPVRVKRAFGGIR